jgi:hypothetical protein
VDDAAAGTRERHAPGAEPRPSGEDRIRSGDWAAIFGGVTAEVDRSVLALRRMLVIETAKWRVALIEGLYGAALAAVGGIVGLVVAVLGTVFLLLGIRGALVAATGGKWWVDLLLGAIILGGIGGGIVWMKKRASQKQLERTHEKLAEVEAARNGSANGEAA